MSVIVKFDIKYLPLMEWQNKDKEKKSYQMKLTKNSSPTRLFYSIIHSSAQNCTH
ncbi:hypothetical protein Hanom_Chr09g00841171 [Helianthus anomalus]